MGLLWSSWKRPSVSATLCSITSRDSAARFHQLRRQRRLLERVPRLTQQASARQSGLNLPDEFLDRVTNATERFDREDFKEATAGEVVDKLLGIPNRRVEGRGPLGPSPVSP